MLTITKIIEGGIDLATREELPRCVVVSNGAREVTVPVPNGAMEKIVQLYIEGLQVERTSHANQVVQSIKGLNIVEKAEVVDDLHVRVQPKAPTEHIEMKVEVPRETSDYDEPPPSSDVVDDDSGFQPGEEYDDSGTGAASL